MSRREASDADLHGFQPVDPWKSEDVAFTRRNLAHLEVPGATYFVTFRCCSKIALAPEARALVIAAIQACDRKSIELDAAVVMLDHAHAIFRLIDNYKLSRVLQRIKGRSARQVNQALKRAGAVWMDESFDHIIRNEAELQEKIEYIRRNPVKAGLINPQAKACATGYRWLYVRSSTA